MSVKAASEVTIVDRTDAQALVEWHYSTTSAVAPSAPTTTDASVTPSGWSKTEPTVTSESDLSKYDYTCLQIVWGDGSCEWGDVVLSASFEAAKVAYNKAAAAQTSANDAATKATNFITTLTNGIMVHPSGDSTTGWSIGSALEMLKSGASMFKAWVDGAVTKVRVGLESAGHILLAGSAIEIFNGSHSVAKFGETVRIGESDGYVLVNGKYLYFRDTSEEPAFLVNVGTYSYDDTVSISSEDEVFPQASPTFNFPFFVNSYTVTIDGTVDDTANWIPNLSNGGYTMLINESAGTWEYYKGHTLYFHGEISDGAFVRGAIRTPDGIYLKDSMDTWYPGMFDNGSNLWIGSKGAGNRHHRGRTYISTGHNGTSGNSTIYVSVPNAANNDGTAYEVYHKGHKPALTDLSGTLAAGHGGTGQTSLQATRNAMGLGNTTGALPIANGGTGQTGVTVQGTINTVVTSQTNVTVTAVNARKWGPVMFLKIGFKFKSDVSVPATGNITNVTMMTIASAYRPVSAVAFHDSTGDAAYFGDIAADGTITLRGADSRGTAYTLSKDTQRYINAVFFTA